MRKLLLYSLGACILALSFSCKQETLDFDKLSNLKAIEQQVAAPLAYGNITIDKLIENDEDSLIVVDGDTVKLVFTQDSVFHVTVRELMDIPEQTTTDYIIAPTSDMPLPPIDRIELAELVNDTLFPFNLDNSMRLDSIYVHSGNLVLDVSNTFNHDITLKIFSVSLISPEGNFFLDSIVRVPANDQRSASFNIDNYIVHTVLDSTNNTAISVKFMPVIHKNPADDFIRVGEELSIDFGIDQVDDFDAIFGFFGFLTEDIDTLLEDFAPEVLEGLEGELSVTNPMVRLNYLNSIGVSADVSLLLNLLHSTKPDVGIDLGTKTLAYSNDYENPNYFGEFLYDKSTVPNIDELISLPMPEGINAVAHAESNVGADSATTMNWALRDSEILINADIEVPLELRADLTYLDTMKIRDEAPEDDLFVEVEYADLYYTFENSFPLGFGAELILYDSIASEILDTISLSQNGEYFIAPAPVDQDGNVAFNSVVEHKDNIRIDGSAAEIIINEATHIIVKAKLLTTDYGTVNSVRVSAESALKFHFGIDAKATFYTE